MLQKVHHTQNLLSCCVAIGSLLKIFSSFSSGIVIQTTPNTDITPTTLGIDIALTILSISYYTAASAIYQILALYDVRARGPAVIGPRALTSYSAGIWRAPPCNN